MTAAFDLQTMLGTLKKEVKIRFNRFPLKT